jgi:3'(2'), 5'-bisphosphate nucleotidase
MGGAGKKSLTILEGQADLFIYLGTRMSKWDICAPEALVRAFGV